MVQSTCTMMCGDGSAGANRQRLYGVIMGKPAMEEALLKRTRNLIASRIGLLVREYDDALLRKVVAERVRALNLSGAEPYCQLLGSDADIRRERNELTILLTTGETYFFRDRDQHALLQDRILPELLERRKAERARCASGAPPAPAARRPSGAP